MNNIEDLFNELLLPLTDKTKKKKGTSHVKPEQIDGAIIFENGNSDETTLSFRSIIIVASPQPLFNFASLLGQISYVPQLTEEAKTILNELSDRMNECKRVVTEANRAVPITGPIFEKTLAYLYYLTELLPLFANNRLPFVYQLPNEIKIQHTSLVFEYLVTLWMLVLYIYRHMDLAEGVSDPEKYTKHVNSLDFCIHVLREMATYASQVEKNLLRYHRYVYRTSPKSISNVTISSEVTTSEELEESQHEKDVNLILDYFGGSRGINARLHVFYAKKYELSLSRALHIIHVVDILGNEDVSEPFVTIENASHIVALAGVSLQISQHYGTACKKIRDDESSLHRYTFYKSTFWQCVAHFLRASIDFFQYQQREDLIDYSKQALKRAETIKSLIDSFNYVYRERPMMIKAMANITTRMNDFFEMVNQKVKIINHRSADDVTLSLIEETMADESGVSSVYQEQMNLFHKRLCIDDPNQVVKQSLALLYKLKKGGASDADKNMTITIPTTTPTNPEDKIAMAVLYERYNWAYYLVKQMTTDMNGDAIICIKDVDFALKTLGDVKEMIKENLLMDRENVTASSLSNKLSSHLYM